jgi:hypothetical protein
MTRFEVVDLYLRAHIGPLLQNAAAYVDVAIRQYQASGNAAAAHGVSKLVHAV